MDTLVRPNKVEAGEVDGEWVSTHQPLHGLVSIDWERVDGEPCIAGTRVPVRFLWQHLAGGCSLDDFLSGYPTVPRDKAARLIEMAGERLLGEQPTPDKALEESGLTLQQFYLLLSEGAVTSHPQYVSGAVVFTKSRVPVYNLWDYLLEDLGLEQFLDDFPTVKREHAERALQVTGGVPKRYVGR